MEYYWNCLAILEELGNKKTEGIEIQKLFIRKYRIKANHNTTIIGINKALKQLRKNKNVKFKKDGVNVIYWYSEKKN